MNCEYKLFAFDFDGTLTKRDTLIEFISYVKGRKAMLAGFGRYLPMLILMKLGLFPNGKAKRIIFTYFFAGMPEDEFDRWCKRFADDKKGIIRQKGMNKIKDVLAEGHQVIIVSASIDRWVKEFFRELPEGAGPSKIIIAGTQVATHDGRLTGRFLTKNCYGIEKVNRIKELFPERDKYYLTAFGDSRGDIAMLDYSDEGYYKPFRK